MNSLLAFAKYVSGEPFLLYLCFSDLVVTRILMKGKMNAQLHMYYISKLFIATEKKYIVIRSTSMILSFLLEHYVFTSTLMKKWS